MLASRIPQSPQEMERGFAEDLSTSELSIGSSSEEREGGSRHVMRKVLFFGGLAAACLLALGTYIALGHHDGAAPLRTSSAMLAPEVKAETVASTQVSEPPTAPPAAPAHQFVVPPFQPAGHQATPPTAPPAVPGHPFVVPPVQPAGHQVTPPTAPPAVPAHQFVVPPFHPAAHQATPPTAPPAVPGHPFVVPPVQPAGHQVTPPTAPPAVPGHPFVIPPFQPAARQAATQQAPASQAAKPKLTASAPPAVQAEQIRRIIPHEDMDDGNKCDDDEELHLGLCYTKCSVLTNGKYPYRNTAFSCCEEKKCGLNIFKMKSASFLPCNGYDVSNANGGDGEASCPHAPGVCLKDEEQFGGLCYEKCSILKPDHPNRVGPESCCKTNGVACLNPFNDVTLPSLGVGGGKGDHNEDTPHGVHGPLVALTEGKK